MSHIFVNLYHTFLQVAYKCVSYEADLQDLMYQYSDTSWKASLTEIEVFIGNIMGESYKQTKRQKESSKSMREGEIQTLR